MEGEWADLIGQDSDALKSELPFSCLGRGKEQTRFNGDRDAFFVLQHTFLDDTFEGDCWINDINVGVWGAPDSELSHSFPVLEKAVVKHNSRNDKGILIFFSFQGEVAKLDLELLRIRDGGIGRNERPIGQA